MAIFAEAWYQVSQVRWFCRNDDDWNALADNLKLTPCPHCHVVGALIRHGFLHGHDDSSPQQKSTRARRIFCSNRRARPGCGHTVSVWFAHKIRRLGLTTGTLWKFLQRAISGSIVAAIRAVPCHLCDRTMQRIWRRFNLGQSQIRTALMMHCPPPDVPTSRQPAAQLLAHLQAAFPNADCPLAAFQHSLRTFFI